MRSHAIKDMIDDPGGVAHIILNPAGPSRYRASGKMEGTNTESPKDVKAHRSFFRHKKGTSRLVVCFNRNLYRYPYRKLGHNSKKTGMLDRKTFWEIQAEPAARKHVRYYYSRVLYLWLAFEWSIFRLRRRIIAYVLYLE